MASNSVALSLILMLAVLSSCAQSKTEISGPAPLVSHVEVSPVSSKPSLGQTDSARVKVVLTLDKEALLKQEFLYGADLQFSSYIDPDFKAYSQSLAIGHFPARFKIVGSELQLIAENQRLYSSDSNHPGQLLSRFEILNETQNTLTISGANSAVFLSQVFEAAKSGSDAARSNPRAKIPKDHWIRSFEYVPNGDYLLQETSVIMDDGSVAEFMESVFPKSLLAPGPRFNSVAVDETSRFAFSASEAIHEGEKKVRYASHIDLTQPMNWYATPNTPGAYLPLIKTAVEGWNRYFAQMSGLERAVIFFKGYLPSGVHLGDPRYNVISWDSSLAAGTAHESQATDPSTGMQSHSLIYLPASWLKAGTSYWEDIRFSLPASEHPLASNPLSRTACQKNLREATRALYSGRFSEDEAQVFAKELLKNTLFHEVGHALGLAHNFKGSLSLDRTKKESPFSWSAMDYNDYELERAIFYSLESWDGPLLEYDRQALSYLYNEGKDISSKDPELPKCSDGDEDIDDPEGVDPLCQRYDAENDPSLSIESAWNRLAQGRVTADVSLSQAVSRVSEVILTKDALTRASDEEKVLQLGEKVRLAIRGSLQFQVNGSRASLGQAVTSQVRGLLVFKPGTLPEGFQERALRERVYRGITKLLSLFRLPSVVTKAVLEAEAKAIQALVEHSNYGESLSAFDREALKQTLEQKFSDLVKTFETGEEAGLVGARVELLGSLKRSKLTPFYFGQIDGRVFDFEKSLIHLLSKITLDSKRPKSERISAASSLASFAGRTLGDPAIDSCQRAVSKEAGAAKSGVERETAEGLLKALKPSS